MTPQDRASPGPGTHYPLLPPSVLGEIDESSALGLAFPVKIASNPIPVALLGEQV